MSDNPLEILGTYDIENETRDLQITCLNGTAESFVAHIGATSDPYVASLPMVFANNNFTMERAEAIAKEKADAQKKKLEEERKAQKAIRDAEKLKKKENIQLIKKS